MVDGEVIGFVTLEDYELEQLFVDCSNAPLLRAIRLDR